MQSQQSFPPFGIKLAFYLLISHPAFPARRLKLESVFARFREFAKILGVRQTGCWLDKIMTTKNTIKSTALLLFYIFAFQIAAHAQNAPGNEASAAPLSGDCAPGTAATDANGANKRNVPESCAQPPYADVTAFGARAPTGGMTTASGTCTGGSSRFTSVSNSQWGRSWGFNAGDGITIWGCGARETMATPSGLSVTPSGTWGMAGTESPVTVATGNSTYGYTVIARDLNGGLTLPETPVTITNGLASLGLQTATISTLTRKDDKVIVVLASPPPGALAVGDLIDIIPAHSQQFGGFFNIAKIDSPTQFELWNTPTDTRAQGWMLGDTNTAAGGTVHYFRNNYLKWTPVPGAWLYYVCAKRPGDGNYHLIGMTKPNGTYIDAALEDYGSPYMDHQNYPPYVETPAEAAGNKNDRICTATVVTNDPLSTWVTGSPDGGRTLVLNDAAGQSVQSASGVWDDAPGIRRALAAAAYGSPNHLGGAIYIPPASQSYLINSHLSIPNQVTVWQSGRLTLNETISTGRGDNWFGDWSSQGGAQFGLSSGANITVADANPGLYLGEPYNTFRMVGVSTTARNGPTLIVDDSGESSFELVSLSAGVASSNYLGMTNVVRGTGSIQMHFYNKVDFSGGPDQVEDKSWTPLFWIAPGLNNANVGIEINMSNTSWDRRGIAMGGGGVTGVYAPGNSTCPGAVFTSRYSYRQGGISPMLATMMCPPYTVYSFTDETQDTEGNPIMANLTSVPSAERPGPGLTVYNTNAGLNSPLISGMRSSYVDVSPAVYANANSIPDRNFILKSSGGLYGAFSPYTTSGAYYSSLYSIGMPMHGAGGYSWWFDLYPPSTVTVGAATQGGNIPAGTWRYAETQRRRALSRFRPPGPARPS